MGYCGEDVSQQGCMRKMVMEKSGEQETVDIPYEEAILKTLLHGSFQS